MPVLSSHGEIPATPVDYQDFGGSNKVKCPDCEDGLIIVSVSGRGIRKDPCNTCDGKGVL
jgi:ribosomal protein S27E